VGKGLEIEIVITDIIYLATIWTIPVLVAVTFHEAAHGFVAYLLGDDTAWRLVRAEKTSPALKPLVAQVERWARENVDRAKTEEVSQRFTLGEWVIELDLYSVDSSAHAGKQSIGIFDLRRGIITLHQDLRKALDEKSLRYGKLKEPYLIVVADATGQTFGKKSIHSALTQAVFADEIVQFRGGQAHKTYASNGFWSGPTGPQNRHVSGVLLLRETQLWRLRNEKFQPVMAVNPWAERALPAELRTLQRFEEKDGRLAFRDGERFADIVGIPMPWPSDETN
jgi:hypothetical protein